MAEKGTKSEVGADGPTEKSLEVWNNLVGGIADGAPAPSAVKEEVREEVAVAEPEEAPEKANEPSDESEASAEDSVEEEEVIPRSKHLKTVENLRKRIDALTFKVKQNQAQTEKRAESQEDKLEKLSCDELDELLDNTDDAISDLKVQAKVDGTDVTSQLTQLKELKRNARRALREAPQRLARRQQESLNSVLEEASQIDPDIKMGKGILFEQAMKIFHGTPSLKSSPTGPGEAISLAAQHYASLSQTQAGQDTVSSLNRKVNNLKKKTSLEGKTRAGSEKKANLDKLIESAKSGRFKDKHNLFKALVPESFLKV